MWKLNCLVLLVVLLLHQDVQAYSLTPYTTFDSAPGCVARTFCDAGSVFPSYEERILFVLTNAVTNIFSCANFPSFQ